MVNALLRPSADVSAITDEVRPWAWGEFALPCSYPWPSRALVYLRGPMDLDTVAVRRASARALGGLAARFAYDRGRI